MFLLSGTVPRPVVCWLPSVSRSLRSPSGWGSTTCRMEEKWDSEGGGRSLGWAGWRAEPWKEMAIQWGVFGGKGTELCVGGPSCSRSLTFLIHSPLWLWVIQSRNVGAPCKLQSQWEAEAAAQWPCDRSYGGRGSGIQAPRLPGSQAQGYRLLGSVLSRQEHS